MQSPPWRIVGDRTEVVLTTWADSRVADAVRLDRHAAAQVLRGALGLWSRFGVTPRPLADAARYVRSMRPPRIACRPGDSDLTVVLEALERGVLVAWREKREHVAQTDGAGAGQAAEESAPAEALTSTKTWIEIELLDMDGNPMRGEAYWIKLPDGTVYEGSLDEHGRAYFGELDPGSAEIRWPQRDGDATVEGRPTGQGEVPAGRDGTSAGNRTGPRDWVEIELLDMDDQPVPYERYWIKLPDGTVREGVLDASGRAYFDDLDTGQCVIRWLGRDEEAAVLVPDATAPGSTDRVAAQVAALTSAARDGTPFCEECERARQQREMESSESQAEA